MVRRLEAQFVEDTFLGAWGKCVPSHLHVLKQPHGEAQHAAAVQIKLCLRGIC